jgi:hypothetical protein
MPVAMNSAKKETVIELLEYLIRLTEMHLAEWQAGPSKEAPISDDFPFDLLDGISMQSLRGCKHLCIHM